jgi:hypothetical protein
MGCNLFLAQAITVAQDKAASIQPDGSAPIKPGARITFEKESHDFGQVSGGTKNVYEFEFTNTGDAVLSIRKVSKTCGCTVTALAKKEYAPGESGAVKVTYTAPRRLGQTTKRVYVHSNDKTRSKVPLAIKARVVFKVACEPKRLELVLNKPNAGCGQLTLSSLDGQPFAVTGFSSPGGCITASYDSSQKQTTLVANPKIDM